MHITLLFSLIFISCSVIAMEQTSFDNIQDLDIETFNQCITGKGNYKLALPKGYNMLHAAACLSAVNQAYLLIGMGKYDINQHDNKDGNTPLFLAVCGSDARMVNTLLMGKADPNITNTEGKTPLLEAIKRKNKDMISLLLYYKADPDYKDAKLNASPIHTAIIYADSDIVDLLFSYDASPELKLKNSVTPLMGAALQKISCKHEKAENLRIIKTLLAKNVDHTVVCSNGGDTALHMAVYRENREAAFLLLKAGANPNVLNDAQESPFTYAMEHMGRTMNEQVEDPQEALCQVRHALSMVRLLLLYDARIPDKQQLQDLDFNVALITAIAVNNLEVVKFCLENGADANRKDKFFGNSPLNLALHMPNKRRARIVTMLLFEHGAVIDQEDTTHLYCSLQEYSKEYLVKKKQEKVSIAKK